MTDEKDLKNYYIEAERFQNARAYDMYDASIKITDEIIRYLKAIEAQYEKSRAGKAAIYCEDLRKHLEIEKVVLEKEQQKYQSFDSWLMDQLDAQTQNYN